ncbi:DUF938 domain-containing protein [Thermostichus vulcanus]|uniref:DUF938 domain-containing protein n=1 Tax=Thermostichus vulcanus str. 'Rupite' TaxID=2813851 RepID=A0ABT0C8U8_THEVL|nr:DUF938 domain-containing protein [Thermostichus vulcanus]MCJ2542129.1 DUF938 domain-containing protein [Thermostichus vulcanus str. 'Rupite']
MGVGQENRRHAPATLRNRDPILRVLEQVLPSSGRVLEVGSGTGEHAVYFAPRLPHCIWQPSEPDPELCRSIQAWQAEFPAANLRPPIPLDVRDPIWPVETPSPDPPTTAMVSINLIHISPWASCLGLMAGAGRILPPDGILYLYGPFRCQGEHTAPSNAQFDASLRAENPEWGVRDLENVVEVAEQKGLILKEVIPMPANNLSVVFQRK